MNQGRSCDKSAARSPDIREADLNAVLDDVGIGVILIDASGEMLAVNGSVCRMFGYAESTLPGQNVRILMPKHHASLHDGYLQRYLETGVAHVIGKGRRTVGVRRDGQQFPIHLGIGCLEREEGVRFVGVIHDLTGHTRAREDAARLSEIVEGSVNEVFIFDRHTLRLTYVNQSAVKNLGYSPDELLGMTPLDIKPEYDTERFSHLIAPLLGGEKAQITFETLHQRKDGSVYPALINLHLSDAVFPPEFVAITQDMTERQQAVEALDYAQRMEVIGQLTGGIAHDFNNLLTVVSGNLELLQYQLIEPEKLKLVDSARQASDMGARLTQRLLSFARRSYLKAEPLDLNELVLGVMELIHQSMGPDVVVSKALASDLWTICTDRSHLENALLNLALNARDAMRDGGRVVIRTENRTLSASQALLLDMEAGDYACVSVADTGTGIGDREKLRIFEPFYTTKSMERGSGLGLSSLYGFVKQSAGGVSVESKVGVGSCFTLFLPALNGVERLPSGESKAGYLPLRTSSKVRILVVEDEPLVRELTVNRLRRLGHAVVEAKDGKQALQVLSDDPTIELLFSDIVMTGGLSGIELRERALSQRPTMKVMLTTGYAMDPEQREALENADVEILQKPYDEATLMATLATVLGPD